MVALDPTQTPTGRDGSSGGTPRRRLLVSMALDVALPLGVYYGLRALGAGQWLALVLSGAIALARLAYQVIRSGKVELLPLFSLTIVLAGTLLSLVTGDPRLLLARESYLTAILGTWILATLAMARPFLFTVTRDLMAGDAARAWAADWGRSPQFRRVLRLLTLGWGGAFLVDAVARVVMAYTLPVDLVPVLSTALLVVLLVTMVQVSKSAGRRMVARRG